MIPGHVNRKSFVLYRLVGVVCALFLSSCKVELKESTENSNQTPAFSISANAESAEWTGYVSFTVTISQIPTSTKTVHFQTVDGTALSGFDYSATSGTLTFTSSGSMAQSVHVPISNDTSVESTETFTLTLSSPSEGSELGTNPSRTGSILDNDDTTWSTADGASTVDHVTAGLGGNLSGLTYQPASVSGTGYLWAVRNDPSNLYRLYFDGGSSKWKVGASWNLTYPGGGGSPDAEGVTKAEWTEDAVYIATERDGGGASKLSILRWSTNSGTATHEWNLTYNAGNAETVEISVGDNAGWEAITWVPDSFLTANNFVDERLNKTYDPADYPNHGTGLFFCGLEGNGKIYVYSLNMSNTALFKKIAVIETSESAVMGLEFDRESGYLWAHCDGNCSNRTTVLEVNPYSVSTHFGKFKVSKKFSSPVSNNHESIAFFPDTEGSSGKKDVFWSDDSGGNGSTLFRGTILQGSFLP